MNSLIWAFVGSWFMALAGIIPMNRFAVPAFAVVFWLLAVGCYNLASSLPG